MTLDEARDLIGHIVIYRAPHAPPDSEGQAGIVTSVNDSWVFVRYDFDFLATSRATPADRLTLP